VIVAHKRVARKKRGANRSKLKEQHFKLV